MSAGAPSGRASAEFSTRGARICERRAMLASLARVAALRRTGLFSRRSGGTGLWTGRPQSGTLRNSVQVAKETPVPAFPLRRQSEQSGALPVVSADPVARPLTFRVSPAPWLRGRRVVTLPDVRVPVRAPRGPTGRTRLSPLLIPPRLPCLNNLKNVPPTPHPCNQLHFRKDFRLHL